MPNLSQEEKQKLKRNFSTTYNIPLINIKKNYDSKISYKFSSLIYSHPNIIKPNFASNNTYHAFLISNTPNYFSALDNYIKIKISVNLYLFIIF